MMLDGSATWIPARVESLKKLWDTSMTAAQIGAKIGLNKNQVIGKAHRLGLKPKAARWTKVRHNNFKGRKWA